MMSRPGGYGETSLLEKNPLYSKYKSMKHYWVAGVMMFPIFLIGILPALWAYTGLPGWLGMQRDYAFTEIGLNFSGGEVS